MPLADWAEEFLSLARRLSPSTQETYARDLQRYILPRFGTYRLGRLPADEIEDWLNDEIAAGLAPSSVHRHYRTLRRVLQVAVEKEQIPANPCDRVQPPRVPEAGDGVPHLGAERRPGRGHHRPVPGAHLPGRRLRDALERARRAASIQGRPRAAARSG